MSTDIKLKKVKRDDSQDKEKSNKGSERKQVRSKTKLKEYIILGKEAMEP